MAKIYGESDSVKSFLAEINAHFSKINLSTFQEFEAFSKNPMDYRHQIEVTFKNKESELSEEISEYTADKEKVVASIAEINKELKRKYTTVKKVWGNLKDEIQNEINALQKDKAKLENQKREIEDDLTDANAELQLNTEQFTTTYKSVTDDILLFKELLKGMKLRMTLKGAYGERKVIEHVSELFQSDSNYHLINAFDINVIGKALSFNEHTLVENKIDHILICPKGIFILETKAWKSVSENGLLKIREQLEKIHFVFTSLFQHRLQMDKIKILLLSTESFIEIKDVEFVDSVHIKDLSQYFREKNPCFTKDEIRSILGIFLPHMSNDQISALDKLSVKAGSVVANFKSRLFKKK